MGVKSASESSTMVKLHVLANIAGYGAGALIAMDARDVFESSTTEKHVARLAQDLIVVQRVVPLDAFVHAKDENLLGAVFVNSPVADEVAGSQAAAVACGRDVNLFAVAVEDWVIELFVANTSVLAKDRELYVAAAFVAGVE